MSLRICCILKANALEFFLCFFVVDECFFQLVLEYSQKEISHRLVDTLVLVFQLSSCFDLNFHFMQSQATHSCDKLLGENSFS